MCNLLKINYSAYVHCSEVPSAAVWSIYVFVITINV